MPTGLVYVLPVHNEEAILEANVGRLVGWLESHGGGHVLLVENGSRDRSWPIAEALEASAARPGVTVRAFREPNKGIGWAYHRGMTEAVSLLGPATDHWVVLTAADLPFGFSDVENAEADLARRERALMGSKAHPDSAVITSAQRKVMTRVYRTIRRVVLGMRVGDSQGSVILRLDLVAKLAPLVQARDFFFTTELCHHAERMGERFVELPIVVEPSVRPSTVRPFHDSAVMMRQLVALRRRG